MTLSRAGSRSQSEPSTESLADALTALCAEVGIPFEEMLHTVEAALANAYIRAFNAPGDVRVTLDTKTGALEVTSRVVRADGTEMVRTLPSEDFKRMAAQTAKHAVLRHIHDLERDKVLRDVAEHRGELATGIVDRSEAGTSTSSRGQTTPRPSSPPRLGRPSRSRCRSIERRERRPSWFRARSSRWRSVATGRTHASPPSSPAIALTSKPPRVSRRAMPTQRHEPVRTCVACRQEADKKTLVRVVRDASGGAAIDVTGHAPGRGAYLHRDAACVEIARKKRALDRALKASVGAEIWTELGLAPAL